MDKDIFLKNFGKRVKRMRLAAGYTQEELANLVGTSKSMISSYEAGKNDPAQSVILKLSTILHVSPDNLMGWESEFDRELRLAIIQHREESDLSTAEVSEAIGTEESSIKNYELGEACDAKIPRKIIEEAFGEGYYDFLNLYGLYDEYIPPQFDGDADAYEAFKAAVDADATATPYQGPNVITFTPEERAMISEYRELDIYGKESVSWTIQHELKRCKAAARHDIPSIIEQAGASYSHRIPFPGKVSAGTGVETIVGYDTIAGPAHADFALLIDGDSMVPRYHDGQVIYIKSQPVVDNGQIAVVQVQGINDFIPMAYLKKVYKEADHVRLASLNRKYADLKVPYEDLTVLGVVIS